MYFRNYFEHAQVYLDTPISMYLIKQMHSCPTTRKISTANLSSFLTCSWLLFLNQFWYAWPCLTTATLDNWINLYLLWKSKHVQKTKILLQLVIEIKLNHRFALLWGRPDMPDHSHLRWLRKFVVSMKVWPQNFNFAPHV